MTATLRTPSLQRAGRSRALPAQRRVTPKASPALRVVDEQARRRKHAKSLIMRAAAMIAVVVVLAALIFQSFLSQGQIRLQRLTVDNEAAQSAYQSQRLAYAEASAPSKIALRASKLGLIVAPVPRFISVAGVLPPSGSRDFESTSSTRGEDWERVKQHLGARP